MEKDQFYRQQIEKLLGNGPSATDFLGLHISELELKVSVRAHNAITKNFEFVVDFLRQPKHSFIHLRNVGVGTDVEIQALQKALSIIFDQLISLHLSNPNNPCENHSLDLFIRENCDSTYKLDESNFYTLSHTYPNLAKLSLDTFTHEVIEFNSLTQRAKSAIKRHFLKLHDLLNIDEDQLGQLRNVGANTSELILDALKDANDKFVFTVDSDSDEKPHNEPQSLINTEDLYLVNLYRLYFPAQAQIFFNNLKESEIPNNVKFALENIHKALFPGESKLKKPRELDQVINTLIDSCTDDRSKEILKLRYFDPTNMTLEEAGHRLNITRERVRQIESGTLTDIHNAIQKPEFSVFGWILDSVKIHIGHVFTERELTNYISTFMNLEVKDESFIRKFLKLIFHKDFRYQSGFFINRETGYDPLGKSSIDLVFKEKRCISELEIDQILIPLNWSPDATYSFKQRLSKTKTFDLYFPKGLSQQEIVYYLLSSKNEPLTFDEIFYELHSQYSRPGLRDRIRQDQRLTKTMGDKISLTEWGLDSIGTTTDEIDSFLKNSPNQTASISDLVCALELKGFKPSTVNTYASVPKYKRYGNKITFRSNLDNYHITKSFKSAKSLFPNDRYKFSYRLVCTPEIIKGMGPSINQSVFAFLNGSINKEVKFINDNAEVRMTWPDNLPNPTLSSLGPICKRLNAVNGDLLLLSFDLKTFDLDYRLIKSYPDEKNSDNLINLIFEETGINLKGHSSNPISRIAELFNVRSDSALRQLLVDRKDDLLLSLFETDTSSGERNIEDLL